MKKLIFVLCLIASPVWAVLPDEIMSDPVLEARAREMSKGLRCLVCRNESIDESNADLARDLRLLVRERLSVGETDDEVMAYIVDRYGEYVLLRPTKSGSNMLLWLAGPLMLLLALGTGVAFVNGRRRAAAPIALSDEEKARVASILDD